MARNSSVGNLRSSLDCSHRVGLQEDILQTKPMPRLRQERVPITPNNKEINNKQQYDA
jgi:hypothetical protein